MFVIDVYKNEDSEFEAAVSEESFWLENGHMQDSYEEDIELALNDAMQSHGFSGVAESIFVLFDNPERSTDDLITEFSSDPLFKFDKNFASFLREHGLG